MQENTGERCASVQRSRRSRHRQTVGTLPTRHGHSQTPRPILDESQLSTVHPVSSPFMHLFVRFQPDFRAARSRAIRLSLGIFAALIFGMHGDRADASCGDYVHVGMPGPHRSVMAADTHEHAPPIPFDRPCHGPGCRQNQPDPLIPTTVPPQVSSGEHACLLIDPTIIPDRAWDNLADASPAPCAGYRQVIEPPPRTAAPSR